MHKRDWFSYFNFSILNLGWYSSDVLKLIRDRIHDKLDSWREHPKKKKNKKISSRVKATPAVDMPNAPVPIFFQNNGGLESANLPSFSSLYQQITPSLNSLELVELNEDDELANFENLDNMVTFDYDE